jgi:hypothetical protein
VNKSKRLRWAWHVACIGERRGTYRVLMGKPERKRPLVGLRHGWGDNIHTDVREASWGGINWIDVAQDRNRWQALVNAVMNLRVP